MSSKGQGLSLSTIVIAALVLVVLVILVMLTTGYFGKWTPKFSTLTETSCKALPGEVLDVSRECTYPYKEGAGVYDDVGPDKKCCIALDCKNDRNGNCRSSCLGSETVQSVASGCAKREKCCVVYSAVYGNN